MQATWQNLEVKTTLWYSKPESAAEDLESVSIREPVKSRSAKFNMRWHIRIEMDEVENTRVAQEDTISDREYRNICCDVKPS